MSGKPALHIWMNGERCGRWGINAHGVHTFEYDSQWRESAAARPISLSMPMGLGTSGYSGPQVEALFDNLLPDNPDTRRRIQARVGAASSNAFDLLREIGGDCAGALQFLPEGTAPQGYDSIQGEPLDEAAMAAKLRLRLAPMSMGLGDESDFRLSLAGAQEKTAFLCHEGKWHQPLGSTPTTHIFKFPMGRVDGFGGDLSTSVENEWLCARIAREFGLPAAESEMAAFEDIRVLIVKRFDRKKGSGGWWLRLPQEDLYQALAVPKGIKYESEGGPGMDRIMALLLGSHDAEADRLRFFKSQLLFWLLCAPDGHARNFSVFIEPGGRYSLTPLYDVISAYPLVGHGRNLLAKEKVKMAISVQGKHKHQKWDRIIPEHWREAARRAGMVAAGERAIAEFAGTADAVASRVASALPAGFPVSVSDPILNGLRDAARRLAS